MPFKDKEKDKQYHKEYSKKWKAENREKYRKRMQEWQENNRDKTHEYQQKYYWANREKEVLRIMQGNKRRYKRQRIEVLEHYGNKCVCCGEHRTQFLGIDHINGDGATHRKELKKQNLNIYEYILRNNYPDRFRVLCHNCNLSIGFYGFCPHQIERGEKSEEDIII